MIDLDNLEQIVDDGIQDEESNIHKQEDTKLLEEWYEGGNFDKPEFLDRVLNDFMNKITTSLGLEIINSAKRMSVLQDFLVNSEKDLYNTEIYESLTDKEKMERYKECQKTYTSLMETQRKFLIQNRDSIKQDNTEAQKILNKLLTLSNDKLNAVMNIINSTSSDSGNENNFDEYDEYEDE